LRRVDFELNRAVVAITQYSKATNIGRRSQGWESGSMLTPEELRSSKVDFEIAKEALAQSEKRLRDALDDKKDIEQKATVLFGAYITITLALFGVGGAFARDAHLMAPALPFFVSGSVFLIGVLAFVLVFKSAEYGYLGTKPSMWLVTGRIDGDKQALARMFAYLTYHHANRIEVSDASNARKSATLHFGMVMGVIGAVVLVATMAFTYAPVTSHP
jgi:hypothetical protein